ncbi:MAG: hypothetical protein DMD87_12660 [Candidatus Rokuibacteriota bacterium]|nr:MAG: hypothetical protein DMD87_12660 [Candidatus Rokubacteria bacterium]
MSRATRLMAGLILVLVPTIELGGSYLLAALIDRDSGYMTNALRQNFFRAGHAHAGVLTSQRALLEMYVGIERRVREELASHPQLPFTLATLHYGQYRCRAMLAWCAESIRALRRLEGRRTRPRRR